MNLLHRHRILACNLGRDGVTLVELLVATVLSSLLILIAVVLLGSATDSWKDSSAAADTLGDGRSAMLIMRRDFANRLRDTPVFVDPRVNSLDGLKSNVMAFFTVLPRSLRDPDVDRGDVGLVAYYTAFTPDAAGGSSPKLHRAQLSPAEVWAKVESGGWEPNYVPNPVADEASGRAEIVASNVLQFAVTGLVQDDSGAIFPVPPSITSDTITAAGIELVLRVVEPAAAVRLMTEGDWTGTTPVSDSLFDDDGETNDDAAVRTFRVRF